MLSINIKNLIKEHANLHKNEEVCGLIIKTINGYLVFPCNNISFNKKQHAILDPVDYINAEKIGKIVGTYHSQESDGPSLIDNLTSDSFNLFSIIYCWNNDKFYLIEPKLINYLYKDFSIGKYDCFTLVRDYYKNELNINIFNYARKENWFIDNNRLICDNISKENFIEVDKKKLKQHDILLFGKDKENLYHMAIYLKNDIMVHHPRDNKSIMEELNIHYKNKLITVIRHKNL